MDSAPQMGQNHVAPQEAQKPQENAPAVGVQQQERQLIRTATVDLRSDDVLKAIQEVKNRAQAVGGFAGQENSTKSSGSVTLRVPSNELDGLVRGLDGNVGEVTRSEVRSDDVTDQLVDVEARIATQRASVDRMRALFERAGSTAEIAQIEGELTKRQSELESLLRRNESLKGKVALATLTVQVSTVPIAPPAPAEAGFGSAFIGGLDALLTVLGGLMVGIGAVLPFAVAFGVPAAVVIYLLRRRRRAARSVTRTTEPAA